MINALELILCLSSWLGDRQISARSIEAVGEFEYVWGPAAQAFDHQISSGEVPSNMLFSELDLLGTQGRTESLDLILVDWENKFFSVLYYYWQKYVLLLLSARSTTPRSAITCLRPPSWQDRKRHVHPVVLAADDCDDVVHHLVVYRPRHWLRNQRRFRRQPLLDLPHD